MFNSDEACDVIQIDLTRVRRLRAALVPADTVTTLAETFRALGDPTRVRILDVLSHGELCVCDLAAVLSLSQSAVSHQLRLLATAPRSARAARGAWCSTRSTIGTSSICSARGSSTSPKPWCDLLAAARRPSSRASDEGRSPRHRRVLHALRARAAALDRGAGARRAGDDCRGAAERGVPGRTGGWRAGLDPTTVSGRRHRGRGVSGASRLDCASAWRARYQCADGDCRRRGAGDWRMGRSRGRGVPVLGGAVAGVAEHRSRAGRDQDVAGSGAD